MALAETLPVYRDCYRLLMLIMDVREQFPKGYRYEFGSELMMTGVRCCEILRWANTDRARRAEWLQEFLVKFDTLRLLLRICQDRKIISITRAVEMLQLVSDVEKQVTGWRNASTRKPEL